MSLSIQQKEAVISAATEAIATAQAGVLAEYRGLSVAELTELRGEARKRGVWVKVVKNNLAKRAVADSDFACLSEHFVGPVIFSVGEDPVAVAKVASRFAKDHDDFRITVGAMQGTLLDTSTIERLAKLPERDELIAQVMGAIRAPTQKFVSTLNEVPSRFVRTLAEVARVKEAGAEASSDASAKAAS